MCGIAGIVTAGRQGADAGSRILTMQHALLHRGPDDRGVWLAPGGCAAFAHTRLALIDPTPAGRQPMSIDGGRLTIIFNGAIYNFLELRHQLERQGASFQTHTDTEVILRAYQRYGDACVEQLRGMFAFAIWDETSRTCVVARDRFGIKPLYCARQDGRLVFASELRALVASGLVPQSIDPQAAYEYFRHGSVPEPRTLLAAVQCLGAGTVATWYDGQWSERRYWDLSFRPSLANRAAVAATREALSDSVLKHCVGSGPIAVLLSGGIDSTAILALARQAGQEVGALTMALPGSDLDEIELARRTAKHFGVRHQICEVDAGRGSTIFADYLRVMDQPSIDGMNTLAVSRLAQAAGFKRLLSGLGADELFGGYPSIRAVPKFDAWNRRLAAVPSVRPLAGRMLAHAADPRWRRLGDLLTEEPGLSASYSMYRGIFTRAEAATLTHAYLGECPNTAEDPDETIGDDPTPEDAACRLEITRYMRNQLLRDTDVMSMACGVEVRLPYVDPRVVMTVTAVGQAYRLRHGKALLHDAVPEIPSWVAQQPKRGFMFPVEAWMRNGWAGTLDRVDDTCPVPTGPWYRKWCVRAFEGWLAQRGDHE